LASISSSAVAQAGEAVHHQASQRPVAAHHALPPDLAARDAEVLRTLRRLLASACALICLWGALLLTYAWVVRGFWYFYKELFGDEHCNQLLSITFRGGQVIDYATPAIIPGLVLACLVLIAVLILPATCIWRIFQITPGLRRLSILWEWRLLAAGMGGDQAATLPPRHSHSLASVRQQAELTLWRGQLWQQDLGQWPRHPAACPIVARLLLAQTQGPLNQHQWQALGQLWERKILDSLTCVPPWLVATVWPTVMLFVFACFCSVIGSIWHMFRLVDYL
jgi:hypothetical protein